MKIKHYAASFLLIISSCINLFGQVEKPVWPNDKVKM